MADIKAYKLLKITSTMTMDSTYLLCYSIDHLEDVKEDFEKALYKDDNGDSCYSWLVDQEEDESIIIFDDYTSAVDIIDIEDTDGVKAILHPDTDKAYLFDEVIEYKERF